MKKVSVLDTDFISKAHSIRSDDNTCLIDRIMELPGYHFCCHKQTKTELARHDSSAPGWLDESIKNGRIEEYTDDRLIREMSGLYFKLGTSIYTSFLRNACDAFDRKYFDKHYSQLGTLDHFDTSDQDYLNLIKTLDDKIGEGNNLGEIKEYIVLQWMNRLNDEQAFYFCSDDRNARNGILSVEGISVQCISIPSVFQRLISEGVFTAKDARAYTDGAVNYFHAHKQENIRVIEASDIGRHMRVPCSQVFDDIIGGKFIELPSGLLKYRRAIQPDS